MSFSEKVGAFYQSASNAVYNFGVGAKESLIKAGTYISETGSKVYAAALPHFQRFKETSVKFFQENKTGIGLVVISLGIGAAIGAAITRLVKGKSQEVAPEKGKEAPKAPEVVDANKKKPPTGGVEVLLKETPPPLKKTASQAVLPVKPEKVATGKEEEVPSAKKTDPVIPVSATLVAV